MRTQKEILRDKILTAMRPYLAEGCMEILNQTIIDSLFNVDVVEMENTLPATVDNTNDNILNLFLTMKAPKLSDKTVKFYLGSISKLLLFINKSLIDIRDMDIECYLQSLVKSGIKAVSINNELRNISAIFTWMRKSHLITENPCDGIEKFKEVEKPIDHLEDWEMEDLREACKTKTVNKCGIYEYHDNLRDRALIEFLRSTAVRIGECVSVNRSDIDWNNGQILVYGQKGRAYRTVCLDDTAKYHLKRYLDSRTDDNPALFAQNKAPHERMSTAGLRTEINEIAKRSNLERRVYPHLFRKTTASNMAAKGCQRELIAFYLGHKNGNTKTLNKHYAATDPQQIINAFKQFAA